MLLLAGLVGWFFWDGGIVSGMRLSKLRFRIIYFGNSAFVASEVFFVQTLYLGICTLLVKGENGSFY